MGTPLLNPTSDGRTTSWSSAATSPTWTGDPNYGLAHEAWIEHSRKTKGTKVVVVGPRKTVFAERMNRPAIRPGTEVFFLLGMLSAAVAGDWRDKQFVDDYAAGWIAGGSA